MKKSVRNYAKKVSTSRENELNMEASEIAAILNINNRVNKILNKNTTNNSFYYRQGP